jgi:hypothetical protein
MKTRLNPPQRSVTGHRFSGGIFPALADSATPTRTQGAAPVQRLAEGEIGAVTRAGTGRMTVPEPTGSGCCGPDK